MSQELNISRSLEIEKEKVHSRIEFRNSQSSRVVLSLFINSLQGWYPSLSYLLCFLHVSLDGRNVEQQRRQQVNKNDQ